MLDEAKTLLSGFLDLRKAKLVEFINENKFDGILITDPYNIFYILDFFFVPTERPTYTYIDKSGETIAIIPMMEIEEANRCPKIDNYFAYFEYPGVINANDFAFSKIKEKFGSERIFLDNANIALFKKMSNYFKEIEQSSIIYDMRLLKDKAEIEFLKISGKYSDYMVESGLKICKEGLAEMDLLSTIKSETTKKMIQEMGEIIYVPGGPTGALVPSGTRTGMPHALPSSKKIGKHDSIILSCGTNVHGYYTESERTCFMSKPDSKKTEIFLIMAEAQEMGIRMMKPGVTCSDIDREVLAFLRKAGYGDYLKHRVGHGKGLQKHEAPWVEVGDKTPIQVGMCLSSEPGIYIEGSYGFRHSDTLIVTEGEPLILTKFPRGIESLTI